MAFTCGNFIRVIIAKINNPKDLISKRSKDRISGHTHCYQIKKHIFFKNEKMC